MIVKIIYYFNTVKNFLNLNSQLNVANIELISLKTIIIPFRIMRQIGILRENGKRNPPK